MKHISMKVVTIAAVAAISAFSITAPAYAGTVSSHRFSSHAQCTTWLIGAKTGLSYRGKTVTKAWCFEDQGWYGRIDYR